MKVLEEAQNRSGSQGIWVLGPLLLLTCTMNLPETPLFCATGSSPVKRSVGLWDISGPFQPPQISKILGYRSLTCSLTHLIIRTTPGEREAG